MHGTTANTRPPPPHPPTHPPTYPPTPPHHHYQPSPATRFLLSAEAAGLPATLVLNKADLVDDVRAAELVAQVKRSWGHAFVAQRRGGRGQSPTAGRCVPA